MEMFDQDTDLQAVYEVWLVIRVKWSVKCEHREQSERDALLQGR